MALTLATACSAANSAPASSSSSQTSPPIASDPGATTSEHAIRTIPAPLGDPKNHGAITAARIVGAVGDGPATDGLAYARAGQPVTLHAVIDVGRAIYSDASIVVLRGRTVRALPLAEAPAFTIRWHKLEPAAASYSNTDATGFHFTPIEYRTTPMSGGGGSNVADIRPTLTPDHGHGVGTMRFQIIVAQQVGREVRSIASAGPEARRGKGAGGVTEAVMRVSIRRDDSFLGFLTEMYGQPYVWASAGMTDGSHQSERLEGSDCADFMVYGARRMGATVGYTWTGGLPKVTKLVAVGARDPADGIYRDAKGKPLPFPRVGDLILFPRHVGALAFDRGTLGVLDDQDLMMHTLFDSPKEEPIADSGYADKPIEIRRFR